MKIRQYLNEGISIIDDKVVMNTEQDSENDILNLLDVDIYEADFLGNVYYFGYRFNDTTSRKDRTTIIKWLKGITPESIDNKSLRQFIRKPLLALNHRINLTTIDAVLYPRSNRSNLNKVIANELNKLTSHKTERRSFELIKTLPNSVQFDWNMFNYDYEGDIGDNQYKQIHNYIENTLIPKIHDLSYFSIADNVKYKYRQYIKDYLKFPNEDVENTIKAIQSGTILIVDDINTSGSTLTEILRIVHQINNNCNIYIFTLIGKE